MRPLASLLVLAACISPAPAAGSSLVRAPVEDVGLPSWCDWGYDWNERCFRDDTARLPVGGVDDKVWRAALGFSLEGLPARAAITSARLDLFRRRVRGAGSPGRPMSRRRVHARCARDSQRELDKGARGRPRSGRDRLDEGADELCRVELVGSLLARLQLNIRGLPNRGVLLELAKDEEDDGTSGPCFPSSSSRRSRSARGCPSRTSSPSPGSRPDHAAS